MFSQSRAPDGRRRCAGRFVRPDRRVGPAGFSAADCVLEVRGVGKSFPGVGARRRAVPRAPSTH